MATFAVASSPETIERGKKLTQEVYCRPEDTKEEQALIRIFEVAEKDKVRGTHPALAPQLDKVDKTITTLIEQINGVVSGQDSEIEKLQDKLNAAIEEKRSTIEAAKAKTDEANIKAEAADAAIKQASADAELARTQAQAEIDSAKKDAAIEVKRANAERDQAIRERDDARTISAEKTASNDLLMRQMASMEADVQAHKELQKEYDALQARFSELEEKSKEDARAAAEALKDIQRDLADKNRDIERAQMEFNQTKKDKESLTDAIDGLKAEISQMKQAAVKAEGDAALLQERAVREAERKLREEYHEKLRAADKEGARLQATIEQIEKENVKLQEQIAKLMAEQKK